MTFVECAAGNKRNQGPAGKSLGGDRKDPGATVGTTEAVCIRAESVSNAQCRNCENEFSLLKIPPDNCADRQSYPGIAR